MSTKQGIKLTPKGKRWGDVIRKELNDPTSYVSRAVRDLRAWARIAKTDKRVKLELDCLGHISVNSEGKCSHITLFPDVSYLFDEI